MKVVADRRSPNFTDTEIPVEFVVLHYTGVSLRRTLEIFEAPERQASSHLVIDADGTVYEMVPCLEAPAKRAWHAGNSRYELPDGTVREQFNDFSIGIEIVNPNGNLVPFTDAQYTSIVEVLRVLAARYPTLADPERIVGHEQIAGFRGKADPGRLFDWSKVFGERFGAGSHPVRIPVCPDALAVSLERVRNSVPEEVRLSDPFSEALSALTETAVRLAVPTT